jgi:hypothetical protein
MKQRISLAIAIAYVLLQLPSVGADTFPLMDTPADANGVFPEIFQFDHYVNEATCVGSWYFDHDPTDLNVLDIQPEAAAAHIASFFFDDYASREGDPDYGLMHMEISCTVDSMTVHANGRGGIERRVSIQVENAAGQYQDSGADCNYDGVVLTRCQYDALFMITTPTPAGAVHMVQDYPYSHVLPQKFQACADTHLRAANESDLGIVYGSVYRYADDGSSDCIWRPITWTHERPVESYIL